MSLKVLIAEDEDITLKHLLSTLAREGYDVVGARNGREAMAEISRDHFDVLITGLWGSLDGTGKEE